MTHWDRGRAAARKGVPKAKNPFNHPDRQGKNNERNASNWDEGWEVGRSQRVEFLADEIFDLVQTDQGKAFISDGMGAAKSPEHLFAVVRHSLKRSRSVVRKTEAWLKKYGQL